MKHISEINEIKIKSFIFHCTYRGYFEMLNPDDVKILILSIFEYVETREMKTFKNQSELSFAYNSIIQQIEADLQKYEMKMLAIQRVSMRREEDES